MGESEWQVQYMDVYGKIFTVKIRAYSRTECKQMLMTNNLVKTIVSIK